MLHRLSFLDDYGGYRGPPFEQKGEGWKWSSKKGWAWREHEHNKALRGGQTSST
jgi:hypothetical protein